MTKTIEIAAKKVDDAIKKGLEELGATLDEVDVTVLDAGGFLKKARVRLTLEREDDVKPEAGKTDVAAKPESKHAVEDKKPTENKAGEKSAPEGKKPEKKTERSEKPEKPTAQKSDKTKKPAPEKKAEVKPDVAPATIEKSAERKAADSQAAAKALDFVGNIVKLMGFDGASVSAAPSDCELINVSAPDGDDSLIIGRHGETLSALSYLAETAARAEKSHINITVDCNGYRDRRAASLTAMAKRRANECAAKHRKIRLEPMERIDRRTVHNALTGDDRVSTASEGKEPKRYVVIIPKS